MTAAVPDPRFRDQLAENAIVAVGDMAADWWCPKREGVRRDECRYCIAEVVVDALATRIAAQVGARVQAAANQRAVEELRSAADVIDLGPRFLGDTTPAQVNRNRANFLAAALASLASAPQTGEGQ